MALCTLCKIPKFHLISSCRNFVETHTFGNAIVRNSAEIVSISQNLQIKKLSEITAWLLGNELIFAQCETFHLLAIRNRHNMFLIFKEHVGKTRNT